MYKGFYNLTSAMLNHGKHLDVISNNMTNVSTAGFKADIYTGATFDNAMWERVGNKNKNYTDLGEQSFITAPSALYTVYDQTGFDETGLPLDFGIEGAGFFAVEGEDGREYTRNGQFSLDNEGYLYLPGEGRVLDREGNEIRLITDKLEYDDYGGLFTEDGGFLGRIGVYEFADYAQLEKNDRGLFVSDAQPQAVTVKIHPKMLERSNVDWVYEMSAMISTQRAYQSAAEAIRIYDNVMRKATEDVGQLA